MESNTAFIESCIILKSLSPLGEIVGDHQIDTMAEDRKSVV